MAHLAFPEYVHPWVQCLVWALTIVLVLLAAVFDLRARIIPNTLTYPAMLLGLAINGILGGTQGIATSGIGLLLGGALLVPFFLLGGFGGGDVKLMAAIGALLGVRLLLDAMVFTALAGALVALVVIVRSKAYLSTLRNFGRLVRLRQVEPPPGDAEPLTVPYGVAIALGTCLAVVFQATGRTLF